MKKVYDFSDSSTINTLNLQYFRGVDFANNPLNVDVHRSPDALNLYSNLGGFPVSRSGYEVVLTGNGAINGIYELKEIEGDKKIVHIGTNIYEWLDDNSLELLYEGAADNVSTSMQLNSKLWIFDGKKMLGFGLFDDEYALKPAEDFAYVPTTHIAMEPGVKDSGVSYEEVNLLTSQRKNTFYVASDMSEKYFYLDEVDIDETDVVVRQMVAEDDYVTLVENSDYTVYHTSGYVKFSSYPDSSPITGVDNIEITFSKTVAGNADKINGTTIVTTYGVEGMNNRLFVTGNANYPNMDFFSSISDPTYFGEYDYASIGGEASPIMGYSRLGDGSLAIHKADDSSDSLIYYRTGSLVDDEAVFSLQEGAGGIGIVASRAIATLINDPLILSTQGVYAVVPVTNSVTNERYAVERSYFINPRLTEEENLENAVAVVYNNRYYLAINGNVYVADSRQVTTEVNSYSDSYQYEWYFFNNIPATSWFKYDGDLYFGTADGRICRFFQDDEADAYKDDGENILCYWKTPILNLGYFTHYKTLKNAYAVPSPYVHSEINIDYILNSIPAKVKDSTLNIFDFDEIDFSDFSFETDTNPRIISTNTKAKKFMLIQFRLWSESGKPFGLYAFTITYTVNGKYKG